MSFIRHRAFLVLFFAALILPASADRYVWINSPDSTNGQFTSWLTAATNIVDAINVATNHETIWVTNGTYTLTNEIPVFKDVVLLSVNGRSVTLLNGNYSASTIRCLNITNTGAVVDGFTLTNGYAETGGGLLISNGVVRNCLITGNVGSNGAGVIMYGGTVANCTIRGNQAGSFTNACGAGAYLVNGMLSNCAIIGNSVQPSGKGAGVYCATAGKVMNCLIAENVATNTESQGGGVYLDRIANNGGFIGSSTIASNYAPTGAGMYLTGTNNFVTNCIIYSNALTNLFAEGANTNAFFNSCAPFTNFPPSQHNTTNNPLFVSVSGSNYRPASNSPCLDQGTNHDWMTNAVDLDGNARIVNTVVDMGAYERPLMATLTPSSFGVTNSVMRGNTTNGSFSISENGSGTDTLYWVMGIASNWIRASPTNGTLTNGATTTVAYTNGTVSLTPGAYQGQMVIVATNINLGLYEQIQTSQVTVVLNVMELGRDATNLSATVMSGENAADQTFHIWNIGGGNLAYTLATNVSWLSASPVGVLTGQTSGATNVITVSFHTSGLGAGTYGGAVTVEPTVGGGSKVVDVSLTVYEKPDLVVSPGILDNAIVMGQNVGSRTVTVWNTSSGGYAIGYVMTANRSWMSLTGPGGAGSTITGTLAAEETNTVTVSYATSGFQVGVSNATITVVATNASGVAALGSPQNVAVRVTVRSWMQLNVSQDVLENTVIEGYNAVTQQFEVWNGSGTNTMSYRITDNVPWLRAEPAEGVSTGEYDVITVSYSTTSLGAGTSNAVITVSGWAAGGGDWEEETNTVAVELMVKPVAMLGCDGVDFGATNRQGHVPASRQFGVWNNSMMPRGGMSWTVGADVPWVSMEPKVGRSEGETNTITMRYDTAGLGPGRYHGRITVSGEDETTESEAVRSPQQLEVELIILGTKELDFLGDGEVSDLVVYQESTGNWYIQRVTDDEQRVVWFGGPGYKPAPGDYDGDGRVDLGVYRAGNGMWYTQEVGSNWVTLLGTGGGLGYEPVGGDYDGDGRADFMVYAETTGIWCLQRSSDGAIMTGQFGGPGFKPKSGDYDGDEISDAAVYDQRSGNWYIITVNGVVIAWNLLWGGAEYTPVVGDYDGDERTDLGAYHVGTGLWFLSDVERNVIGWWVPWGGAGFTPVAEDYNGDQRAELAVYQESSGLWFIRTVSGTILEYGFFWGGPGYTPVP